MAKKPNATSIAGNNFSIEANECIMPKLCTDKMSVCQSCDKNAPAKKANTSNLMVHLKEHHAELYVEAISAHKPRDTLIKEIILLTAMVSPLVLCT